MQFTNFRVPRKLTVKMNYLGIDLGGTKTLFAVFDDTGNIIAQKKIKTDTDYEIFIRDVEKIVDELSTNTNISACCIATPGLISRDSGIVHSLGNIGWKEKHLKDDVSKAIGGIPVIMENDACLAGLAEAIALIDEHKKILYFTISTGIGGAWLENGQIAESLKDMEPGHMPLLYEGQVQKWESFASGKAIISRYGKQASEIQEENQWQEIGERIAYGVAACCSVLAPEVIVFGGGAGQFADKFTPYVDKYLDVHLSALVNKPKKLLKAVYGADSAIYGCFYLLKQKGLVK